MQVLQQSPALLGAALEVSVRVASHAPAWLGYSATGLLVAVFPLVFVSACLLDTLESDLSLVRERAVVRRGSRRGHLRLVTRERRDV